MKNIEFSHSEKRLLTSYSQNLKEDWLQRQDVVEWNRLYKLNIIKEIKHSYGYNQSIPPYKLSPKR